MLDNFVWLLCMDGHPDIPTMGLFEMFLSPSLHNDGDHGNSCYTDTQTVAIVTYVQLCFWIA